MATDHQGELWRLVCHQVIKSSSHQMNNVSAVGVSADRTRASMAEWGQQLPDEPTETSVLAPIRLRLDRVCRNVPDSGASEGEIELSAG